MFFSVQNLNLKKSLINTHKNNKLHQERKWRMEIHWRSYGNESLSFTRPPTLSPTTSGQQSQSVPLSGLWTPLPVLCPCQCRFSLCQSQSNLSAVSSAPPSPVICSEISCDDLSEHYDLFFLGCAPSLSSAHPILVSTSRAGEWCYCALDDEHQLDEGGTN